MVGALTIAACPLFVSFGDALAIPPAQFLVTPLGLSFGPVQVGSSAPTQSVAITNVGAAPVVMSGFGGAVAAPFNATQDCQGNTLNPGDSCHMYFDFAPTSSGSFSATSTTIWNGQSVSIALAGEGVAPRLRVAQNGLDFGTVQVGTTSQLTSTITNTGTAPVTMSGFGGAVAPPFNATQDCQGNTLNPGDSCHMYFDFTPTSAGPFSATSTTIWNGETAAITLTGVAIDPSLRATPTALDYGQIPVNTSAPTQTTTITNVGTAPIVMSGFGGAVAAPFNAVQDCQGNTLNPGDSCHMYFDYHPTTTGTFSATSTTIWNGQTINITLTGSTPADTTPPTLILPSDLSVNAATPSGASVSFAVTATDEIDPHPKVVCDPPSGSVFPIGTTTVACTATDASNNVARGAFGVHVKGTAEQLGDLATAVATLNPGSSYSTKVTRAQGDVATGDVRDACATLSALANQFRAQSGKTLPAVLAAALIADTRRIQVVLGC
jgi:uncharacterized Zn ribbon protein